MKDADVRSAVWRRLEAQHRGDADTLMLNEFGLWHGAVRVDIAVINGRIEGYELKSDRDTLERLPEQANIYSGILDRATLVVGARHAAKVIDVVPDWWSIDVAVMEQGEVRIEPVRAGVANPDPHPLMIAALLWREEALAVLADLGADRGVSSKRRREVYQRLTEVLPLDELRAVVRQRIKSRGAAGWRADPPST